MGRLAAGGGLPALINPPDGRLWSANNRVVGEPFLSRLGLGTYDHGGRAGQIRDGLGGDKKFLESDMLRIQLDDRALFLSRWQRLLLDVLTPAATADHPHRLAIRAQAAAWGARASPGSVGFRLVKRFRIHVRQIILDSLTAPCARIDPRFRIRDLDLNVEDSIWQLVTQQPAHLLPPHYASWNELLLAALDQVEEEVRGQRPAFMPALRLHAGGRHEVAHPPSVQFRTGAGGKLAAA